MFLFMNVGVEEKKIPPRCLISVPLQSQALGRVYRTFALHIPTLRSSDNCNKL